MASNDPIVKNGEKLTQIFGKWPSFHDAEVMGIAMERNGFASLTLIVRVFQRGNQVNEMGYFERLNECLATMRFDEIREVELLDFNHQNVIQTIQIEEKQSRQIEVVIHSSFGLRGKFVCSEAEVVQTERFTS